MYYCITLYKVVKIQILNQSFCFCSNVRLSVGLSNPFKLSWKRLSKICFWSFFRKFFLCSNGNNFVLSFCSLNEFQMAVSIRNIHSLSLSRFPVNQSDCLSRLSTELVCMMFLFRERTFLCKEYHTWSSLYGFKP